MLMRLDTLPLVPQRRSSMTSFNGEGRERGSQPVHHGDRGIVGPPDAEHDLDRSRIVLGTEGGQVAQEERLVAVERLQQADARTRLAAAR